MPRVRVLFLGGTIAMTGSASAPGTGLSPQLGAADLIGGVPLPDGVQVGTEDVARVDSSELTLATCLDALGRADDAVRRGEADGVVVVQGTDTLEETAYLWDLLWPHPLPFVVTGAMRPADAAGADGPANLLAAVSVAADPGATELGVVVVIGDEVHAARLVTKGHTSALSAFRSPELGPLGRLHHGRLALSARLPRLDPLPAPDREARVGLLRASLDDDPALYRAAAEVSDGLVVEGFGAGQVRPEVAEVLLAVTRELPVVLVSRTGAGPVSSSAYSGPGSGARLIGGGVLDGGRLGGLRARILLRVLLGAGASADEVSSAVERHGR